MKPESGLSTSHGTEEITIVGSRHVGALPEDCPVHAADDPHVLLKRQARKHEQEQAALLRRIDQLETQLALHEGPATDSSSGSWDSSGEASGRLPGASAGPPTQDRASAPGSQWEPRLQRVGRDLDASLRREAMLQQQLVAAQECFKTVEQEVWRLQVCQAATASQLQASLRELMEAQHQLMAVQHAEDAPGSASRAIALDEKLGQAVVSIQSHAAVLSGYLAVAVGAPAWPGTSSHGQDPPPGGSDICARSLDLTDDGRASPASTVLLRPIAMLSAVPSSAEEEEEQCSSCESSTQRGVGHRAEHDAHVVLRRDSNQCRSADALSAAFPPGRLGPASPEFPVPLQPCSWSHGNSSRSQGAGLRTWTTDPGQVTRGSATHSSSHSSCLSDVMSPSSCPSTSCYPPASQSVMRPRPQMFDRPSAAHDPPLDQPQLTLACGGCDTEPLVQAEHAQGQAQQTSGAWRASSNGETAVGAGREYPFPHAMQQVQPAAAVVTLTQRLVQLTSLQPGGLACSIYAARHTAVALAAALDRLQQQQDSVAAHAQLAGAALKACRAQIEDSYPADPAEAVASHPAARAAGADVGVDSAGLAVSSSLAAAGPHVMASHLTASAEELEQLHDTAAVLQQQHLALCHELQSLRTDQAQLSGAAVAAIAAAMGQLRSEAAVARDAVGAALLADSCAALSKGPSSGAGAAQQEEQTAQPGQLTDRRIWMERCAALDAEVLDLTSRCRTLEEATERAAAGHQPSMDHLIRQSSNVAAAAAVQLEEAPSHHIATASLERGSSLPCLEAAYVSQVVSSAFARAALRAAQDEAELSSTAVGSLQRAKAWLLDERKGLADQVMAAQAGAAQHAAAASRAQSATATLQAERGALLARVAELQARLLAAHTSMLQLDGHWQLQVVRLLGALAVCLQPPATSAAPAAAQHSSGGDRPVGLGNVGALEVASKAEVLQVVALTAKARRLDGCLQGAADVVADATLDAAIAELEAERLQAAMDGASTMEAQLDASLLAASQTLAVVQGAPSGRRTLHDTLLPLLPPSSGIAKCLAMLDAEHAHQSAALQQQVALSQQTALEAKMLAAEAAAAAEVSAAVGDTAVAALADKNAAMQQMEVDFHAALAAAATEVDELRSEWYEAVLSANAHAAAAASTRKELEAAACQHASSVAVLEALCADAEAANANLWNRNTHLALQLSHLLAPGGLSAEQEQQDSDSATSGDLLLPAASPTLSPPHAAPRQASDGGWPRGAGRSGWPRGADSTITALSGDGGTANTEADAAVLLLHSPARSILRTNSRDCGPALAAACGAWSVQAEQAAVEVLQQQLASSQQLLLSSQRLLHSTQEELARRNGALSTLVGFKHGVLIDIKRFESKVAECENLTAGILKSRHCLQADEPLLAV